MTPRLTKVLWRRGRSRGTEREGRRGWQRKVGESEGGKKEKERNLQREESEAERCTKEKWREETERWWREVTTMGSDRLRGQQHIMK